MQRLNGICLPADLSMLFCLGRAQAQEAETYVLHQTVSNRQTIVYTRVIRFDDQKHLFHVKAPLPGPHAAV